MLIIEITTGKPYHHRKTKKMVRHLRLAILDTIEDCFQKHTRSNNFSLEIMLEHLLFVLCRDYGGVWTIFGSEEEITISSYEYLSFPVRLDNKKFWLYFMCSEINWAIHILDTKMPIGARNDIISAFRTTLLTTWAYADEICEAVLKKLKEDRPEEKDWVVAVSGHDMAFAAHCIHESFSYQNDSLDTPFTWEDQYFMTIILDGLVFKVCRKSPDRRAHKPCPRCSKLPTVKAEHRPTHYQGSPPTRYASALSSFRSSSTPGSHPGIDPI